MVPFWVPLGVHFGALGGPSWPQVGSKTPLATPFLSKSRFSKKARKTNGFSMFLPLEMAPKTPQDHPKTPPRWSQRGTFSMFKIVIDFGALWAPFWVPLGGPFGSQKGTQNRSNLHPWLRAPPRSSKKAPRGPKRAPRGPQEGPRRPQESPQEAPRWPARGTKRAPRSPQGKVGPVLLGPCLASAYLTLSWFTLAA